MDRELSLHLVYLQLILWMDILIIFCWFILRCDVDVVPLLYMIVCKCNVRCKFRTSDKLGINCHILA